MSYNVVAVPEFRRELKRLSKKYRSLKTEIAILFDELTETPTLGHCFKRQMQKRWGKDHYLHTS